MADLSGAQRDRARADALTLDNHHVVRDGSVWVCVRCRGTWPYPQPLPRPTVRCVPRRWDEPDVVVFGPDVCRCSGHAGPHLHTEADPYGTPIVEEMP